MISSGQRTEYAHDAAGRLRVRRSADGRRLRTSNMLERLSGELKRRTRVATLFPNEASILRLVTVVLAETSDEWETGRIYLCMGTE